MFVAPAGGCHTAAHTVTERPRVIASATACPAQTRTKSASAVRWRLLGNCQLVRFADDFVVALEDRQSGKRLLDVLGKRLVRYGLTLHKAKTCYVDFRRRRPHGRHWMASATTFDFLGFTHVWGQSLQGKDVVRQITAKGRFARALKSVHDWCKRNRHCRSRRSMTILLGRSGATTHTMV